MEYSKYVVLGNVDAGKTSFIGVMEKNVLDDGNGYSRSLITTLKHEKESGRTSSHSPHYIIKNNEITTLIDLCGHEKYLKTTLFGVMGLFCDYGIIIIGANMGITKMTTEYISILISNKIPFIVIITKIDICPNEKMIILKRDLERIAKRTKKDTIIFEEEIKDTEFIIESFQNNKIDLMPIIMISNKTGHNIDMTRNLLSSIKSINNEINENYPMIMFIDSIFNVMGIGIVLCGTVKYGSIKLGQKLYLGPINNIYITITVKSIHNCIRENVSVLEKNQTGSIGIRLDTKNSFRKKKFIKGQILTDNKDFAYDNTYRSFNADIAIFNHPTTIQNNYQTVIHCNTIRQTGKFKIKENQILRSHSKDNINIIFISRSEFILPGTIFMFRDGKTKGIGKIINGLKE